MPADLAEAVREKREHAKEEAVRWASLNKITGLNAQVESAKKSEELRGVRAELEKNNFATANHADVREAAATLDEKIWAKRLLSLKSSLAVRAFTVLRRWPLWR